MRYADIVILVQDHYRAICTKWKNQIADSGTLDAAMLRGWEDDAKELLAYPEEEGFVDDDGLSRVDRFIRTHNLSIPKDSKEYTQLRTELCHALLGMVTDLRDYGDNFRSHIQSSAQSVPIPVQAEQATTAVNDTYKAVLSKYLAEKMRGEAWGGRAKDERRAAFDLLEEIIGANFDVRLLDFAQAREIKEILVVLPKNRSKHKETRGLHVRKQIQVPNIEKIASATINKYLGIYSAFMDWAWKHGYAPYNPFADMSIADTDKINRKPFEPTEVSFIISTLDAKKKDGAISDSLYWGVLLGLYTGARAGEITGLTPYDIKAEDGIWYFDINDEVEMRKSVKTAAAIRLVPVHQDLLDRGILDFLEVSKQQPDGKRFLYEMSFSGTSGWHRKLTRWFNEKLLVELELKSDEKVFHSLRHTVITKLAQASVPLPIIQNLVGHEPNTVTTGVYTHGYTIQQLNDGIQAIQYPQVSKAS